ncbi:MAG TPA: metalloregulator ArsR/SmtB family transcription factor [Candidatus Acidoferrales bacterium]|jgi:DNA-binding transcriptional ArsR family regulator|nr:metalloregulator ArsR/SmtB family transcription factor [Candidatus Acidoferrales bacterium]
MRSRAKTAAAPESPAPVFAALGDTTRLWLVSRLCDDGPLSIMRLTAGSGVTRQAITKHLRVMERAGVVQSTRRGRESVWQLDRRRMRHARRYLDMISRQWDEKLARLRIFVED